MNGIRTPDPVFGQNRILILVFKGAAACKQQEAGDPREEAQIPGLRSKRVLQTSGTNPTPCQNLTLLEFTKACSGSLSFPLLFYQISGYQALYLSIFLTIFFQLIFLTHLQTLSHALSISLFFSLFADTKRR